MIDGFDAVDDGAAHEGDLALIFGDFFVGVDAAGGHGEIEFYDIARLPISGDLEVPILQSAGGERLAVDFDGEGRDGGGIGEAVEIGRNGKTLRPAGDAEGEREVEIFFGGDGEFDLSRPRVIGLLGDFEIGETIEMDIGGASGVEINEELIFGGGVDEAADLGDEAGEIGGAAGETDPGSAAAIGFSDEGILVEELIAGEGDAGDRAIVEGEFHDIGVFGVGLEEIHAMLPEEMGDGSAGFAVTGVGEDVGSAEAFVAVFVGSEATGEVHFSADDIAPEVIEGVFVAWGVGVAEDIGHSGVEVTGADGVTDGFELFDDGFVVLHAAVADAVTIAAGEATFFFFGEVIGDGGGDDFGGIEGEAFGAVGVAAFIEEKLGEIEVAGIVGGAKEFNESEFDFLVAIDIVAFFGAEDAVDVIGEEFCGIEGFGGGGEALVFGGEFEVVPRVIHLVHEAEVIPALGLVLDDEIGDEEAVFLLGGEDAIEDGIEAKLERFVGEMLEREGGAFEDFIEIGIEGGVAGGFAFDEFGGFIEIDDVAIFFEFVEGVGEGDGGGDFLASTPEAALEVDLFVADLVESAFGGELGVGGGAEGEGEGEGEGGDLAKREVRHGKDGG